MSKLLFREECYSIQGAVFEVYREMGSGGEVLNQFYKPDLICFDKIIVELKALREITGEHRSQVLNYLKATGMRLGLLVNFGQQQKAVVERIVF